MMNVGNLFMLVMLFHPCALFESNECCTLCGSFNPCLGSCTLSESLRWLESIIVILHELRELFLLVRGEFSNRIRVDCQLLQNSLNGNEWALRVLLVF